MIGDFLKKNITSGANYVEFGYGQVEPNHLSAQRTAQIYAQLPAAAAIDKLEQGQFVKYDYANGVVNFTGAGEWMLVYNEIKLYRDGQLDCEFAMVKDHYNGRVYSPAGAESGTLQSRHYNGKDAAGNTSITIPGPTYPVTYNEDKSKAYVNGTEYAVAENKFTVDGKEYADTVDSITFATTYNYDRVTVGSGDYYEPTYNDDPFHIESKSKAVMMPAGTTMVPRVFKTNVGDIFTTNTIKVASVETGLAVGDVLHVGTDGYLTNVGVAAVGDTMKWQVVKVYTMPDRQRAVKIMRIA